MIPTRTRLVTLAFLIAAGVLSGLTLLDRARDVERDAVRKKAALKARPLYTDILRGADLLLYEDGRCSAMVGYLGGWTAGIGRWRPRGANLRIELTRMRVRSFGGYLPPEDLAPAETMLLERAGANSWRVLPGTLLGVKHPQQVWIERGTQERALWEVEAEMRLEPLEDGEEEYEEESATQVERGVGEEGE